MTGVSLEAAPPACGRLPAATASREYRIGRAFVELADTLVDGFDVVAMLTRLVDLSVDLLAVDAAGLMLGDSRRKPRVAAVSNRTVEATELLQLHIGQGPGLACYRRGSPVTVTDLAATDRWPRFTAAAGRPAFRSVHALPLRLRGQVIGVLSLFHGEPGPLPDADLALGQALADVATVAILSDRTVREAQVLAEQLKAALDSRVVIEQAKGVLIRHYGLSPEEAFSRLRGYVRGRRLNMAVVARLLVTRQLDPNVVITEPAQR